MKDKLGNFIIALFVVGLTTGLVGFVVFAIFNIVVTLMTGNFLLFGLPYVFVLGIMSLVLYELVGGLE